MAEAREKSYAQRREAGRPPLLPKIPDDEWVDINGHMGQEDNQCESEETELKDDDSSLNQSQEKGHQGKESSELFGTQQFQREDSVVSHQKPMVEPQ